MNWEAKPESETESMTYTARISNHCWETYGLTITRFLLRAHDGADADKLSIWKVNMEVLLRSFVSD